MSTRRNASIAAGVTAFLVVMVGLLLAGFIDSCHAAPAFDSKAPVRDGQVGSNGPGLLSIHRVYPFVGVTDRISFPNGGESDSDLLWVGGLAYSLGVIAPQIQYRWGPEETGPDVHELELGLRMNARAFFGWVGSIF